MAEYDPQIIQKITDRLYRRARTVIAMSTNLFVLIGGGAGLGINLALGEDDPSIVVASIGAVILGAVGYVIGREGVF